MTFKKIVGKLHLWLGLASGLLVLFLGITGCILAFETEIEDFTQSYRFTEIQHEPVLKPSALKAIAEQALHGKKPHSVSYEDGRSARVTFYNEVPDYYYVAFINPYSGEVLAVKDMDSDFFRIVIMGHYYLWLPPKIGQPIVATGTLIFVIMLISGLVLWWPRSKAARKQRFSVKLNTRWRRLNYDLHNVLGFYMTWVIIFIALSGLVMGFQWFSKSVYWVASGGKTRIEYTEALSDSSKIGQKPAQPVIDLLWQQMKPQWRTLGGSMEVHIPENTRSSIEIAFNPDPKTYWQSNYRYFDQNTLREIEVRHPYGKLKNASVADRIMRMNYDIHVGAIAGPAGKTLAFFASLIAASMPVTGFLIWKGRRKKKTGA